MQSFLFNLNQSKEKYDTAKYFTAKLQCSQTFQVEDINTCLIFLLEPVNSCDNRFGLQVPLSPKRRVLAPRNPIN